MKVAVFAQDPVGLTATAGTKPRGAGEMPRALRVAGRTLDDVVKVPVRF